MIPSCRWSVSRPRPSARRGQCFSQWSVTSPVNIACPLRFGGRSEASRCVICARESVANMGVFGSLTDERLRLSAEGHCSVRFGDGGANEVQTRWVVTGEALETRSLFGKLRGEIGCVETGFASSTRRALVSRRVRVRRSGSHDRFSFGIRRSCRSSSRYATRDRLARRPRQSERSLSASRLRCEPKRPGRPPG